jgi:hypothetical protein
MFQVEGDAESSAHAIQLRQDVRFIGALAGRFVLSDRPVPRRESASIFTCRTCSVSPRMLVISSTHQGRVGETISARFEVLGAVHGRVSRQLQGGMQIEVHASDEQRDLLAKRISWLKKRMYNLVPDKRVYKRIASRNPSTTITLADGTQLPCIIIDVSQSGIAVAASAQPELGTPMAIGKAVGRVVRHLDVGFAVQFIEVHDLEAVDALVGPPLVPQVMS